MKYLITIIIACYLLPIHIRGQEKDLFNPINTGVN